MWESVETYAPSVLQNDSILLKSIVFPISQGNAFLAADDPVTCAIYARENGLLDLPGWHQFRNLAK
jgi:hypothetical protein